TGIGLSLVNELVSLLGGTIAAESELTVGTTFRLTLPVGAVLTGADVPRVTWAAHQQADAPLPAPEPAPVANGFSEQHQGPRILIVEDNDELREFLVGELASSYTILQAVDGQAGWETAQTELPDIVLTDVMMPRMDGNELTRLIKGHPETDHIAVVMLTAKAAQQSRIDGLQHGADDYLSKPFSVDELHLRLHNLIIRQQKLGDHYRQQFALPASQHTPNLGELNNDPFLHRIYELLEQHLDDSSISVDWLAEQLSMSRKTLYRKVHSLIQLPPADLIRQYRLRKAAELLEAGHTVAEAADLVGFKTPSHFALVFKDFYQQTPSDFMDSRVNNA
ncbi:MAG TPA: response regulator, partial [Fibrella sp.]